MTPIVMYSSPAWLVTFSEPDPINLLLAQLFGKKDAWLSK